MRVFLTPILFVMWSFISDSCYNTLGLLANPVCKQTERMSALFTHNARDEISASLVSTPALTTVFTQRVSCSEMAIYDNTGALRCLFMIIIKREVTKNSRVGDEGVGTKGHAMLGGRHQREVRVRGQH